MHFFRDSKMYYTDVQLKEHLGVLFDEKYMVNWTRCCEMYITEVHLLKCIKRNYTDVHFAQG